MVEHEDHGLRLDFELPAQRGIGFVDLDGSLCLKCPLKILKRITFYAHKLSCCKCKKEEEH